MGCRFPATGQTTCSDGSGTVIPCAGTGQDGDLQKGGPLSYADNGDGTITDNNTGLVWEKLGMDGSVHDVGNTYTWDNAFAVHVAGLNTASFAGHNDWRLPNEKELESIVDYGTFNPAIAAAFDTNCTASCSVTTCSCTSASGTVYWSSTSVWAFRDTAWDVDFFSGRVSSVGKSAAGAVRAVRGDSSCLPATGQTTCSDSSGTIIACTGTGQDGDLQKGAPLSYADNGDGTITDNNTGLVWEKLSTDGSVHDKNNTYTWSQAFSGHVATLNGASFAGQNDWRVPNLKELWSIANYQNATPAVSSAFNNNCGSTGCSVMTCSCIAPSGFYWSSSSYAAPTSAWTVLFDDGSTSVGPKSLSESVRAVRGGS